MEGPVFWFIILDMEALVALLQVFNILYVLAGIPQLIDAAKEPPSKQAVAEKVDQPTPPRD